MCLGRKWELYTSAFTDIAHDVNSGICRLWVQKWNTLLIYQTTLSYNILRFFLLLRRLDMYMTNDDEVSLNELYSLRELISLQTTKKL